jgi:hypothetical protein
MLNQIRIFSISRSNAFRLLRPIAAAACMLALGGVAFAQFETASVLGYVRDSSGAPIPHSAVSLINTATGQRITVQSDAQGE